MTIVSKLSTRLGQRLLKISKGPSAVAGREQSGGADETRQDSRMDGLTGQNVSVPILLHVFWQPRTVEEHARFPPIQVLKNPSACTHTQGRDKHKITKAELPLGGVESEWSSSED